MLAKFATDDARKLFYIKNVEKTYEMFKSGQVPFEWAGFVYVKTKEEFNLYFNADLNFYLSDELKENFNKYSFNPDHGNLWSMINKKLFNK